MSEPMFCYVVCLPIVDLPDGATLHFTAHTDLNQAAHQVTRDVYPPTATDCMIYRLTLEPVARVERNTRIVPVEKVPA